MLSKEMKKPPKYTYQSDSKNFTSGKLNSRLLKQEGIMDSFSEAQKITKVDECKVSPCLKKALTTS